MGTETVKGEEFSVEYPNASQGIVFAGTIRLQTSEEYAPIMDLLQHGLDSQAEGSTLILDFRQLQFLNSSGINTISKFVISARKADRLVLQVYGNKDIYWQQKTLQNLQKLWPKVQIEIL